MADILIPDVVIGEEIGHGSHSVVYRAERAGRAYAAKVPVRAVAYDERTARSFAREATVLACIRACLTWGVASSRSERLPA